MYLVDKHIDFIMIQDILPHSGINLGICHVTYGYEGNPRSESQVFRLDHQNLMVVMLDILLVEQAVI